MHMRERRLLVLVNINLLRVIKVMFKICLAFWLDVAKTYLFFCHAVILFQSSSRKGWGLGTSGSGEPANLIGRRIGGRLGAYMFLVSTERASVVKLRRQLQSKQRSTTFMATSGCLMARSKLSNSVSGAHSHNIVTLRASKLLSVHALLRERARARKRDRVRERERELNTSSSSLSM